MSLTHFDLITDSEERLVVALLSQDDKAVIGLLHPEVVYTNEEGETFTGHSFISNITGGVFRMTERQITNRNISIFTNIAIVNTKEWRKGTYLGELFDGKCHTLHAWKFNGRQWQMIALNSTVG